MAVAINIPVPKPRDIMTGASSSASPSARTSTPAPRTTQRAPLSQSLPTNWGAPGFAPMSGSLPPLLARKHASLSTSLPKQSPGPPHPTPVSSPSRTPRVLVFPDGRENATQKENSRERERERERDRDRAHRRSAPPAPPPSTPTSLVPPRTHSQSSSRAVAGSPPGTRTSFFEGGLRALGVDTGHRRRRRHSISTTSAGTSADRRSAPAHVSFSYRGGGCARGCDDHEHGVGPGGEAVEFCVTGRHEPSHRADGARAPPRGVLAVAPARRSQLGTSCVEPALRDRLLARRVAYARLMPHHRHATPEDNLYMYVERAAIPAWDKWPEPIPVDPARRRRRISLGLARRDPLGLEWTRRRTEADAQRGARALATWEPVTAWDCEVLSYMEDYVPATAVEVVDKHRRHVYTLEADGFATDACAPFTGDDEQRMLAWLTSTILASGLNVVHALRVKSHKINFSVVCPAGASTGQGDKQRLHEGYGTLVLMNNAAVSERCMLVSVRPPSVYDSGTMREFARGIQGWWQFDDVEGQRGQANLLQAQIYDECVTNQVYFWVVTTVSHWVFGQFNMSYTRCWVSPVLSREQDNPGVFQSLVSWMMRAVDELSTRKDPCRLARRNSAPSRMQEQGAAVVALPPAPPAPVPQATTETAVVAVDRDRERERERDRDRRKRRSGSSATDEISGGSPVSVVAKMLSKSTSSDKRSEEKEDPAQREAERDRARERRRLRRDAKLGPRPPTHASATVMGMSQHAYAHTHPHTHPHSHLQPGYRGSALHDPVGQVVYYPYPVTVAQQSVPYQYYWYADPMVLC